MHGRLGDGKLAAGEHEGVHQVPVDDREEWRLQVGFSALVCRCADSSHMTCKKCKWEFCWVCMGPWSEHGTSYYQCNRFDEKGGVDARDAQAQSRASLERYLHVSGQGAEREGVS
jgi:ariadne-1